MQETDLIKSIIERNDSAMEELLKYYGPLIRYVIGPIVEDVQEQEACVSEVAMRIWEKADAYDPAQGKWTGWITAISRNTALNWVRGQRQHLPLEDIHMEIPSKEQTPEEAVVQKETQMEMRQALLGALRELSAKDEALRIWPGDRNRGGVELEENWNRVGDYSGRVLRDKNGERLWADYYYLGDDVYISHSMFNEGKEERDCSAIFSFPHKAENCRGYVAYTMENISDEIYGDSYEEHIDTYVDSWLNYVHPETRVQYPVYTAEELYEYKLYNWTIFSPYWVQQDALQIEVENLN